VVQEQSVKVEPKNLIGRDVSFLPSPTIQLPRIPIFGGGDDSPAYFDILYLDSDLLIIKQNSIPGADGAFPVCGGGGGGGGSSSSSEGGA
jgi:hypothetical protein